MIRIVNDMQACMIGFNKMTIGCMEKGWFKIIQV